jgi:hypothetical protein
VVIADTASLTTSGPEGGQGAVVAEKVVEAAIVDTSAAGGGLPESCCRVIPSIRKSREWKGCGKKVALLLYTSSRAIRE